MDFKIAVLAGDGIGPEISVQGVEVMSAVCEKFGHKVNYEYAICGADAIDKVGDPFPEETYRVCKNADAVLFSAVGDPKFDNDPTAKVRPEQGLLAMRKKLGLFANIRPVQTFKCLVHKSPLRAELVEGADFLCIRELTGGMYFGEKYQESSIGEFSNVTVLPQMSYRDSLSAIAESAFVLNVMPWFKSGIHDRVLNAMYNGAVSITDSSSMMDTCFTPQQDYIAYSLDRIEALPDLLNTYVPDEDFRAQTAARAFAKVQTFTFAKQAEYIRTIL